MDLFLLIPYVGSLKFFNFIYKIKVYKYLNSIFGACWKQISKKPGRSSLGEHMENLMG
jgi:hypothetical protein